MNNNMNNCVKDRVDNSVKANIEKNSMFHNPEVKKLNEELLHFLDESPNAFFAVRNMKQMLRDAGYTELFEDRRWMLAPGDCCFVTRNGSALIAFRIPEKQDFTGFQIMASHSDSPAFKIKPNTEIVVEDAYVKLNVEKYGGMLCAPWFDRPLSVAGRVIVETEDGIETRLVNIDRDLLIIPNLAIHMNRKVNDGYPYNAQVDLLPLFCDAGEEKDRFMKLIADEAGVPACRILDCDLSLYNRMKGTFIGERGEYIASGRLDDLQCAFSSIKGLLLAKPSESIAVHCVFDNEEVGSGSKQGAAGTFLNDTLRRVNRALGGDDEDMIRRMASSFMVSADNAHAVHPNHKDKADPTNRPLLNHGIVIKYSANQKYTTDAVSGAIFRAICKEAGVPYQTFANRSDMIGGSTLGNISQSQLSLNTVDIGLPQLAMHSPYETTGAMDTSYLVKAARVLFSGAVKPGPDGSYRLRNR